MIASPARPCVNGDAARRHCRAATGRMDPCRSWSRPSNGGVSRSSTPTTRRRPSPSSNPTGSPRWCASSRARASALGLDRDAAVVSAGSSPRACASIDATTSACAGRSSIARRRPRPHAQPAHTRARHGSRPARPTAAARSPASRSCRRCRTARSSISTTSPPPTSQPKAAPPRVGGSPPRRDPGIRRHRIRHRRLRGPAPSADAVIAELARQLALVAAGVDPNALRLLLAAESAGALIGVELQAAGLPWRRSVHEAVLEQELGPRPAAGWKPARMEALAVQVREELGAASVNLDSQADLLRALRRRGHPGGLHRALGAPRARPSRDRAVDRLQEARAAAQRERLDLARRVGGRRAVPARVRAGRHGHGAVGDVGRRRPPAAEERPQRGGRRSRLDPRGGRCLAARAAGARGHGPRRGDGRGRSRTRPLPWPRRRRRRRDARRGQDRHPRRDVRRDDRRERAARAAPRPRVPARHGPRRPCRPRRRARSGGDDAARPFLAAAARGVARGAAPRERARRDGGRRTSRAFVRARLGPVHPQLRRAGQRRRVVAVLDGGAPRAPRRDGRTGHDGHARCGRRRPRCSGAHRTSCTSCTTRSSCTHRARWPRRWPSPSRRRRRAAGRLLFGDFPVDFPLDLAVVDSYASAG